MIYDIIYMYIYIYIYYELYRQNFVGERNMLKLLEKERHSLNAY